MYRFREPSQRSRYAQPTGRSSVPGSGTSRPVLRPIQPPIQYVYGGGGGQFPPGIKRVGREAEHLPLSSA